MDSHHTEAEIQAAFQRAPGILKELTELGADLPYFVLFEDASGELVLGSGTVLKKVVDRAKELVHSERFKPCLPCLDNALDDKKTPHFHKIAIQFCCGLVNHSYTKEGG
ncbi:hypothetical protein LCGC14_0448930 [marine sediment metagenome]|uniref:Uncharacterized protein n=1 Tax=marine sediment metagenome TaxID=412755 RepID=A0A0F9T1K4_9ZZZZ